MELRILWHKLNCGEGKSFDDYMKEQNELYPGRVNEQYTHSMEHWNSINKFFKENNLSVFMDGSKHFDDE